MKKLLLFTALASFTFASAQVYKPMQELLISLLKETLLLKCNLCLTLMVQQCSAGDAASGTAMMRSFKSGNREATRMSATFNYNGGDG